MKTGNRNLIDNPNGLAGEQVVDPIVSQEKFNRELDAFKAIADFNRHRGVLLLNAQFPNVILAFNAYRVRPLVTVFAVRLNFINYDLEPPSVTFIDPLTERDLTANELNCDLLRNISKSNAIDSVPNNSIQLLNLIQSHPPANIPFVCLPGVREYHSHPAHTNDLWLNRRGKGEGSLGFIIDQLHKFGTEPINGLMPKGVIVNQVNPASMLVQFQGLSFSRDKFPK